MEKVDKEPVAYLCPSGCGCTWRDNCNGTMSLLGPNSRSCDVCEPLPLQDLVPVFAAATKPAPQVAQPVAWLTSEPDGNAVDGSYGGMRVGVELGAERPEFGTVPLYAAPQVAQPQQLTDEQILLCFDLAVEDYCDITDSEVISLGRAIVSACAEKWSVKLADQEGGAA